MIIQKISQLLFCTLIVAAFECNAGDLSADVGKGANSPNNVDGSYLEVGGGLNIGTEIFYGIPEGNRHGKIIYSLEPSVNLRMQNNGWFVEAFSASFEAFTLGYNLSNSDHWSLDIVGLQQHPEISSRTSKDLKGVRPRHFDFMSGPRATGYLGNYIVQVHALTDVSDKHNGQVLSAKIAHHWQYKNWNIHAIGGVSYRSDKVADYYLSVEPEDATEKFPEFHAQAGFIHMFEVGVTYPLSQQWVFRSSFQHYELESQWSDSPLLASTHASKLLTSISYVF